MPATEDLSPDTLPSEELLPSPCIRVCCLDDDDVCLGCFRTLDDIRNWKAADNAARRTMLEASAQRRAAHDARFPAPSRGRS